jgi:3-deoxy-D-manno-octulosonic-acid transferase
MENESYFHVLVPHHVDENNIAVIRNKMSTQFISYTSLHDTNQIATTDGIIINTVGKLFDLYQYASFVYIGGGFEKGIHNTLEPAVFNVPLAFGPKYNKFPEAKYFIEHGSAKEVNTAEELSRWVTQILSDSIALTNIKEVNKIFFKDDRTVEEIIEFIT